MAIRRAAQDKQDEQDEKATIALADFISQLRNELDKARKAAEGQPLQLEVGPIDVELAVQAQTEKDVGGGLRIYVFEAGAYGKMENVSTQRIMLRLNASVPADGGNKPPGPPQEPGLRLMDSLRAAVAKRRERRTSVLVEEAPEPKTHLLTPR